MRCGRSSIVPMKPHCQSRPVLLPPKMLLMLLQLVLLVTATAAEPPGGSAAASSEPRRSLAVADNPPTPAGEVEAQLRGTASLSAAFPESISQNATAAFACRLSGIAPGYWTIHIAAVNLDAQGGPDVCGRCPSSPLCPLARRRFNCPSICPACHPLQVPQPALRRRRELPKPLQQHNRRCGRRLPRAGLHRPERRAAQLVCLQARRCPLSCCMPDGPCRPRRLALVRCAAAGS